MWEDDITSATNELRMLLLKHLRIRGATLAVAVARAGRLLPRRVKHEARYLAEAERMAANPRLARLVDPVRFAAAQEVLATHLAAINPRDRWVTRAAGIAAVVTFNLLVLAGLVLLVLRWRGFL